MSHDSCETCVYEKLACACCCKEKRLLDTYLARLKNYQCYLLPYVKANSLAGLSAEFPMNNIMGGRTPQVGIIGKAHSAQTAPFPFVSSNYTDRDLTGDFHASGPRVRVVGFYGCCCVPKTAAVELLCFNDCYPIPAEGTHMSEYLRDMTGFGETNTGNATNSAYNYAMSLINAKGELPTNVAGVKGAKLIIDEAIKFYSNIKCNLDC